MKAWVDNAWRELIPLPVFRATHNLPETFAVMHFSPKDWRGLGRIDTPAAVHVLAGLRQQVLAAVPGHIRLVDLLDWPPRLSAVFERELVTANAQIGLREPEIGFAVAGFQDVLSAVTFALVRRRYTHEPFDFVEVYQHWLDASTRLAGPMHTFSPDWHVQIILNPYGRIGLKCQSVVGVFYVADPALACPASGFMFGLCADVAHALEKALAA